jgi:hypothetical protein
MVYKKTPLAWQAGFFKNSVATSDQKIKNRSPNILL